MLTERSFYGLDNWKCFQTKSFPSSSLLSFKKDVIFQENNRGFVVLFTEKKVIPDHVSGTFSNNIYLSILFKF